MTNDLDERVERCLDVGLLGQWYVVAKSSDVVAGKPFAVRALSRALVLWRGEDGVVRCLEDICPHRGAPLSLGVAFGNLIACRYHGIQLDGDGLIASVPALPSCALDGRKATRSFTVTEQSDGIFVYFPCAERPEPTPLPPPPELRDDGVATFLATSLWSCNYRYVLDNLVDPMHGIYLHGDTFTLSEGVREDYVDVEKTGSGFIIKRRGQQGLNFDWAEIVYEGGLTYGRVEIPYPPAGGPGGMMRVLAFVTPVDADACRIFFWRCRELSGLAKEAWRFLYRAAFEERHWHVLEQDRDILEALPRDARKREMLYQHDIGVGHLRRALDRKARSQVAAEQTVARSG